MEEEVLAGRDGSCVMIDPSPGYVIFSASARCVASRQFQATKQGGSGHLSSMGNEQ